MKQPFRQSYEEKKANKLWDSFEEQNQEKFWHKYEKLVHQVNPTLPTIITTNGSDQSIAKNIKTVAVVHQKFHEAIIPYGLRVALMLLLLGSIIFYYVSDYSLPDYPVLKISTYVGTPLLVVLLWRMLIIEVYETGLLVTSTILKRTKFFAWKDIKSVKMQVDPNDQSGTPEITISLKNGLEHTYYSPMRNEKHHDLKNFLENFGVRVFINF